MTIDDELLSRAKAEAALSGRSLGAVVDDGLRILFAERGRGQAAREVVIPTYGGSGLRPGVDLEDKAALADLLELTDEHRAAR